MESISKKIKININKIDSKSCIVEYFENQYYIKLKIQNKKNIINDSDNFFLKKFYEIKKKISQKNIEIIDLKNENIRILLFSFLIGILFLNETINKYYISFFLDTNDNTITENTKGNFYCCIGINRERLEIEQIECINNKLKLINFFKFFEKKIKIEMKKQGKILKEIFEKNFNKDSIKVEIEYE